MAIETENTKNVITVFQEIGANEYLVELTEATHVQELIENGFDAGSIHIRCHPPHGYYLNVSIIGLKAYISDDEVQEKLAKIKGAIIRLKYKSTHELAGLENGNRLVRMVLTSPSIPYSLNIGGEWCRAIHNHQQLICSHCNEAGHSRKNCPQIQCRNCHQLGHISYHCPLRVTHHTETASEENTISENKTTEQNVTDNDDSNMTTEESTEPIVPQESPDDEQANTSTNEKIIKTQNYEQTKDNSTGETSDHCDVPAHNKEKDTASDTLPPNDNKENNMDFSINTKRPHQTDSDSDLGPLPRRQRIRSKKTKTRSSKDRTFNPIMYLIYFCSFVYLAFNLISINSQGLRSFNHRQNVFNLIKKHKYDIIFLQETHWTAELQTDIL